MQWFLRDGPRELVLSTEAGAPLVGSVLVEGPGVGEVLRSLAEDPASMMALREIHAELVEGRTVRDHADAGVLDDLRAEVAAGRLFVFEQDLGSELIYEPVEMAEAVWEQSEPLVSETEEAEEEAVTASEEVVVSAVVLAQVQALVLASAEGVAFCEI